MKRWILLLMTVVLFTGCARTVRPKSITEEAFPLEEAAAMIEILEAPFLTLPREGTISGAQLLEYKKTSALFDETHRASIVRSVIETDPKIADFIIDADETYRLLSDMEYPTVFHEEIEVTDAVVRKTLYKEEYSFFNTEQLIVTETYTGDAPMMKDFDFDRQEDGTWELEVCSGVIVYSFANENPLGSDE